MNDDFRTQSFLLTAEPDRDIVLYAGGDRNVTCPYCGLRQHPYRVANGAHKRGNEDHVCVTCQHWSCGMPFSVDVLKLELGS